jgi:hypothetical protein
MKNEKDNLSRHNDPIYTHVWKSRQINNHSEVTEKNI